MKIYKCEDSQMASLDCFLLALKAKLQKLKKLQSSDQLKAE